MTDPSRPIIGDPYAPTPPPPSIITSGLHPSDISTNGSLISTGFKPLMVSQGLNSSPFFKEKPFLLMGRASSLFLRSLTSFIFKYLTESLVAKMNWVPGLFSAYLLAS